MATWVSRGSASPPREIGRIHERDAGIDGKFFMALARLRRNAALVHFRLQFQRLQFAIDKGPHFPAPLQRFGWQFITHDGKCFGKNETSMACSAWRAWLAVMVNFAWEFPAATPSHKPSPRDSRARITVPGTSL